MSKVVSVPDVPTLVHSLTARSSAKYREPLLNLFREFTPDDRDQFARLWNQISADYQADFVAFVVTGQDADGRFLKYLDDSEPCQDAVDLVFSKYLQSMPHLSTALDNVNESLRPTETSPDQSTIETQAHGDTLSHTKAADDDVRLRSILAQSLEAKATLENLERHLEDQVEGTQIQEKIRQSLSLADEAYRELQALCQEACS